MLRIGSHKRKSNSDSCGEWRKFVQNKPINQLITNRKVIMQTI